MGYLTLDGVYIGDRPPRAIGCEGQMPSALEIAARWRRQSAPKTVDIEAILTAADPLYPERLARADAARKAKLQ